MGVNFSKIIKENFGLMIALIVTILALSITIVVNYKTNVEFVDYSGQKVEWSKRNLHIKKLELIRKIEKSSSNSEKLILVNELIDISKILEDNETYELAVNQKKDILLNELTNLPLTDTEKTLLKLLKKTKESLSPEELEKVQKILNTLGD